MFSSVFVRSGRLLRVLTSRPGLIHERILTRSYYWESFICTESSKCMLHSFFFFQRVACLRESLPPPPGFFLNEAGPAQPGFHSPPSVFYWHKFCLFSVVLQHLLYPPSRSPRASTPCCYQLTGREREEENKKQGEKKTGLLGKQTLVLLLGARSLNPFADSGCWKTARICWKVLQWSHVSLHNRMFQPRDESFLFVLFF